MSAPASPEIPFPLASSTELNKTFGVLMIGFIFAVTLYGLTFFQTYIYFSSYPHDDIWSKSTMGLLWAIDTVVTGLMSHTLYYFTIICFLLPFNVLPMTHTFPAEGALAAAGIFIVQIFFAVQIWTASGKQIIIPGIIALLALVSLAFAIAGATEIAKATHYFNFVTHQVETLKALGYGLTTLGDLVIVGALYTFMTPARHPGMKQPKDLFESVLVHGLHRGVLFSIFQLATLIALVSAPKQQVWVLFHFVTSKVYINALLSMVNFRNHSHGRGIPLEASQNQHSSQLSHSFTDSTGVRIQRTRSRSMHFTVAEAEEKMFQGSQAMTIDLDPVRSQMDLQGDDESDKQTGKTMASDVDMFREPSAYTKA